MTRLRAETIVNLIVRDVCGRCGGDGWWDSIDVDTQQEIKSAWATLIMKGAE